jgi:hypothetical protein
MNDLPAKLHVYTSILSYPLSDKEPLSVFRAWEDVNTPEHAEGWLVYCDVTLWVQDVAEESKHSYYKVSVSAMRHGTTCGPVVQPRPEPASFPIQIRHATADIICLTNEIPFWTIPHPQMLNLNMWRQCKPDSRTTECFNSGLRSTNQCFVSPLVPLPPLLNRTWTMKHIGNTNCLRCDSLTFPALFCNLSDPQRPAVGRFPVWDSNREFPEYEAGKITTTREGNIISAEAFTK